MEGPFGPLHLEAGRLALNNAAASSLQSVLLCTAEAPALWRRNHRSRALTLLLSGVTSDMHAVTPVALPWVVPGPFHVHGTTVASH